MKLFDRTLVLETFKEPSPKPAMDEMDGLCEDILSKIPKDVLSEIQKKVEELVAQLKDIKQDYNDKNYRKVINKVNIIKDKIKTLNSQKDNVTLEALLFKVLKKTSFLEHLNNFKNKSNDALTSLAETLNEAIYNQGGTLLLYGQPLEDGSRRLYVTTAKQLSHQDRVKKDSSAGIPNRNVSISNNVYRLSMENGRLKAKGVAWSSPDGMKKALGLNGSNVGLHYNKTPMHQETLKFNSIEKMLINLHDSIVHIPDVRWQG